MYRYKKIDNEDLDFFRTLMPGRVFTGEDALSDYTHDEMTEYGHFAPRAVLQAISAEEYEDQFKADHPDWLAFDNYYPDGSCLFINPDAISDMLIRNQITVIAYVISDQKQSFESRLPRTVILQIPTDADLTEVL